MSTGDTKYKRSAVVVENEVLQTNQPTRSNSANKLKEQTNKQNEKIKKKTSNTARSSSAADYREKRETQSKSKKHILFNGDRHRQARKQTKKKRQEPNITDKDDRPNPFRFQNAKK